MTSRAHAATNAVGPIANAIALILSVQAWSLWKQFLTIRALPAGGGAVTNRDIALVQACTMLFCSGYLFLVLIANITPFFLIQD
ncbi:hypothetical protein P4S72_27570 [Vibrio sp. PP-XX7]